LSIKIAFGQFRATICLNSPFKIGYNNSISFFTALIEANTLAFFSFCNSSFLYLFWNSKVCLEESLVFFSKSICFCFISSRIFVLAFSFSDNSAIFSFVSFINSLLSLISFFNFKLEFLISISSYFTFCSLERILIFLVSTSFSLLFIFCSLVSILVSCSLIKASFSEISFSLSSKILSVKIL